MIRKIFGTVILIWLVASSVSGKEGLTPGDHKRSYSHGGKTRTYLVHVPRILKSKTNIPVVLAFHGGGTNAMLMRETTDLKRVSEKEGFVVVYPNGTGNLKRVLTWNVGSCCAYAMRNKIDDVGATKALIEDIAKVLPIDRKRIYATGMSNGGMMAYRLACELSDRIAAVAPVAGSLEVKTCNPSRPVPILHIHGTADKNVDYNGGYGIHSISKTEFKSVADSIAEWRINNGCSLDSKEEMLKDKASDKTTTKKTTWSKCKNKSEIILYTVQNGGHAWPGSPLKKWGKFGPVSHDFSAGEVMWEFFSRHPMK